MVKFIEAYYAFLGCVDPMLYFVLGCVVFGISSYVAFQIMEDQFTDEAPHYLLSGMMGMLASLLGIVVVLLFPIILCISIIVLTTIAGTQFVHRLIRPKK